jgi:hypothetical protein
MFVLNSAPAKVMYLNNVHDATPRKSEATKK